MIRLPQPRHWEAEIFQKFGRTCSTPQVEATIDTVRKVLLERVNAYLRYERRLCHMVLVGKPWSHGMIFKRQWSVIEWAGALVPPTPLYRWSLFWAEIALQSDVCMVFSEAGKTRWLWPKWRLEAAAALLEHFRAAKRQSRKPVKPHGCGPNGCWELLRHFWNISGLPNGSLQSR